MVLGNLFSGLNNFRGFVLSEVRGCPLLFLKGNFKPCVGYLFITLKRFGIKETKGRIIELSF
jgi:hypothetical protein